MKKAAIPAVAGILIGAVTSLAQAHCGMCPGDPPAAVKEVKETTGKSTIAIAKAGPDKYIEKLESEGITLDPSVPGKLEKAGKATPSGHEGRGKR